MKLAHLFMPASVLLVSSLLSACSGNTSSSSTIDEAVVTPVKINEALTGKVTTGDNTQWDWDAADQDSMKLKLSHAYRSVLNNSFLATLYREGDPDTSANLLGGFSTFINLFKVDSPVSDCFVSGTRQGTVDANGDQTAIFVQCQNGSNGTPSYFDGAFATQLLGSHLPADESDIELWEEETNVQKLSSHGTRTVTEQDGNGDLVEKTIQITEFLTQNNAYTFYFGGDYNQNTVFDVRTDRFTNPQAPNTEDISGCTTDDVFLGSGSDKTANRTSAIIKGKSITSNAGEVLAAYQQGPDFEYVEYTDMTLGATNYVYTCDGSNLSLDRAGTQYSFTSKLASKEFGYERTTTTDGDGNDQHTFAPITDMTWTGLRIPTFKDNQAHRVEGTITLVHTNDDDTDITVKAVFDGDGNVQVTDGADAPMGAAMTVSEFLALSNTLVATE